MIAAAARSEAGYGRVAAAKSRLVKGLGLACILAAAHGADAAAQSLTILPVNIDMAPGQMASTLTVINHSDSDSSVQARTLAWSQVAGEERLTPSDDVVASPPICTIPAGATQVIRLVLRRAPQSREATYRILLDQIPPAASPGTVRVALRLSIPIFAEPVTRALPHVTFHIENSGGQAWLIATNDGARHEKIRDVAVTGTAGRGLDFAASASPYVLAGAINRRRFAAPFSQVASAGALRLTARTDAGAVDEPVSLASGP